MSEEDEDPYFFSEEEESLLDEEEEKYGNLKFDNFIIDAQCNQPINLEELSEKFSLDVYSEKRDNGVSVLQNGVVMRGPYDLSDSKRKLNNQFKQEPINFTKIIYAITKNYVLFSNPPDIIPIGCWCQDCKNIGPDAHKNKCTLPNLQNLRLTLKGFYECIYSKDRKYRNKLINNSDEKIKDTVNEFMNEILKISKDISNLTEQDYIDTFFY